MQMLAFLFFASVLMLSIASLWSSLSVNRVRILRALAGLPQPTEASGAQIIRIGATRLRAVNQPAARLALAA